MKKYFYLFLILFFCSCAGAKVKKTAPAQPQPEKIKKRFDPDIPLIPEPESSSLCPAELKNNFVGFYEDKGLAVGWRWKDVEQKRILVTFFISPKLIPANAKEGIIRGIDENWTNTKGPYSQLPNAWTEEFGIPANDKDIFPIRRNLYYGWGKYARINCAGASGSALAIRSSDVGFDDDRFSFCILVTTQRIATVEIEMQCPDKEKKCLSSERKKVVVQGILIDHIIN